MTVNVRLVQKNPVMMDLQGHKTLVPVKMALGRVAEMAFGEHVRARSILRHKRVKGLTMTVMVWSMKGVHAWEKRLGIVDQASEAVRLGNSAVKVIFGPPSVMRIVDPRQRSVTTMIMTVTVKLTKDYVAHVHTVAKRTMAKRLSVLSVAKGEAGRDVVPPSHPKKSATGKMMIVTELSTI